MDQYKNIKGIIFDFDGTLFDLEVDWAELKNKLKTDIGVNSLHVINRDSNPQAIKLIGEVELEGVKNGFPKSNALKILNKLKFNYKISVTSRNNRCAVIAGLKKIGFNQELPIVAREDVKFQKPHPEALQLALSKMNIKSSEVLVVGDTNHDIDAAKKLGSLCVVVKNTKLRFVPKGADYYIDTLADLDKILNDLQ